ncbi:hypothetical protein [Aeromonas sp. R9-1]|uniref:hypothetical protein n=1 Tax=Aeromonas sp. R9-1 TaxID=3138478 RepID=UPI0034A58ACC
MQTMTPEFLQQLLLAMDLAERSEHQGSDYEESTFEQGVASALQWVAGMVSCPPLI